MNNKQFYIFMQDNCLRLDIETIFGTFSCSADEKFLFVWMLSWLSRFSNFNDKATRERYSQSLRMGLESAEGLYELNVKTRVGTCAGNDQPDADIWAALFSYHCFVLLAPTIYLRVSRVTQKVIPFSISTTISKINAVDEINEKWVGHSPLTSF